VAACDRVFLNERPIVDAAPPDTVDAVAVECLGVGLVMLCSTIPDEEIVLRDMLDTRSDARCGDYGSSAGFDDACVVAATSIAVPFPLRVVGDRPLILFADAIAIGAPIDASSKRSAAAGPGARTDCTSPQGSANAMFGGGGPGGSHQFTGGPGGGAGVTNPTPGTPPPAALPLAKFDGGCAGGGGGGNASVTPGGAGGGAFYALARVSISIDPGGGINVSGAGGDGGATRHGGGGGGAGGMIGLDAPTITIAGNLVAKGGGGGGGGGNTAVGQPGGEAVLANAFGAVPGGAGGNVSPGNGGDGSNGTIGGNPTNGAFGGGGGGGAAGYVLTYGTTMITGEINPPP
jgi:hypothetical protein